MANIQNILNKIKTAVYGKDVRGSIHDGIKKINDETENASGVANAAKSQVNNIQQQVDNLVVSGDSSVEAAQARVDKDNKNYSSLKQRLDTEQEQVTTRLADEANKINNAQTAINNLNNDKMDRGESFSVSQINKNLGKLDETYMTDEFLQQMAGNTPINGTPANRSLTAIKSSDDSILAQHAEFLERSNNILDEQTLTHGFIIRDTGVIESDINYSYSDYILVKPNQSLSMKNITSFAEYDDNLIFKRRRHGADTVVLTHDTYYIRVNVQLYKGSPQINLGDQLLDYDQYELRLKNSFEMGSVASVYLGAPYKLPNINLTSKKIELFGFTGILFKNKRYLVNSNQDGVFRIDFENIWDDGASVPMIYFNIKTSEFDVYRSDEYGKLTNDHILFCIIHKDGHKKDSVLGVTMLSPYTVNGSKSNDVSRDSMCVMYVGAPYKLPNINLTTKKIELYGLTGVVYNGVRHMLNASGDDLYTIDFANIWDEGATVPFIYFNKKTLGFDIIKSNELHLTTNDHILFCIIHKDGHKKDSVLGVTMLGDYTINGLKTSNGDVNKRFYTLPIPTDWYESPQQIGYDTPTVRDDTITFETIYDVYDGVVADNPEYATKTLLGLDSTDTYPIYKYEFKPLEPLAPAHGRSLPKLILFTNVHGHEKASTVSLSNLIRDVHENWKTNKSLEFIRHNVHLIIIPIVNPWGFANYLRQNGNGVDINRNGGYRWEVRTDNTLPGHNEYKGEAPFSEKETQYVRDVILENKDAMACFDYHMHGASGEEYRDHFWHYVEAFESSYGYQDVLDITKNNIRGITLAAHRKYGIPDDSGLLGYATPSRVNATVPAFAFSEGIPASTLECTRKIKTEDVFYSAETMTISTEFIGNAILNMVRQFTQ